jgi:hypothetical protein
MVAACETGTPQSHRPSTVSATPTAVASALSAAELAHARRFRQDYGLRSDDGWIRAVAADPAAAPGKVKYGVALTPGEVSDLDRRTLATERLKRFVVDYGLAHPESYAGAWIDHQRGGVLVGQFSSRVDEHRAALLSRINPNAAFEVRAVRWSLAELSAMADQLRGQDAWFRQIPAVLVSYGVDEPANKVFVRISSVSPNATRAIEEHYGWRGVALVESDGTGALLLPIGSLDVTVRDGRGRPVAGLRCVAVADLPGAYEAPENPPITDATGRCHLELPATGYWIRLEKRTIPLTLAAIERAVVLAGGNSVVNVSVVTP